MDWPRASLPGSIPLRLAGRVTAAVSELFVCVCVCARARMHACVSVYVYSYEHTQVVN